MRLLRLLSAVFVLALLSGCGYNAIQQKDEAVTAAWSEVLNQYQRRADLVPNVVNTVKGYASHEADVLTRVAEARAQVGTLKITPEMLSDPAVLAKFQAAQGELSSALTRLMAVSENYPQLKADALFQNLQVQLRAPRTASPWRATVTCPRCRISTPTCAASRRTSPRRCSAIRSRRTSASTTRRRSRPRRWSTSTSLRRRLPPRRRTEVQGMRAAEALRGDGCAARRARPARRRCRGGRGAGLDAGAVPPLTARVTDLTGTLDTGRRQALDSSWPNSSSARVPSSPC